MPEPLPQNSFRPSSDEHKAYQSCLGLEAVGSSWGVVVGSLAKEASEAAMFKFSPEVAARVLGYALRLSPSTEGTACLAQEILSCNDEGELLAGLSYLYVMGMIRIFKNPKGSVPTPMSIHSSRPSFQATADSIAALLSQPTTSSSDAKKLALARDDYRCILSGNVDIASFDAGLTSVNVAAGDRMKVTVLGHIFGQSTMDNTAGLTNAAQIKLAWAASAAAVVQRFASISIVEELNQNNIHRAENTFTITPDYHSALDELRISLHPIESDDNNTYEIHTYPPNRNAVYGLPDQVTLTDATGGQIPLPSRRYFQLHDACAKIAHLSGAGEIVERLFRDVEDVKVLAEDGGSQHLLSLALSSHLHAQSVY
ncbi:hypothetical protein EV421DRAFT_1906766 [Armillaria borealis]|uniref:HNH nuclease domain-containing protein n=1 Tax=Armillaria borealis TaxID=47425 RepID=A0AA39JA46_9AGAR|nr:hypothetical protein EV421DRAFT_1906766 [Armillaria borealis]